MRRAALCVLVVLGGCDPGMTMRGSVHAQIDPCSSGKVYGEGEPIEKAEVVVQCGDEDHARLEAVTDMAGRFKAERSGVFEIDCNVRVSAAGFRSAHYRIRDLCAVYSDAFGGCQSFSLDIELLRDDRSAPTALEL